MSLCSTPLTIFVEHRCDLPLTRRGSARGWPCRYSLGRTTKNSESNLTLLWVRPLCLGLEERLCFEERQKEPYLITHIAPNITKRNANPNRLRNSTATGSGFKCTRSSKCPYQFEIFNCHFDTTRGPGFSCFFSSSRHNRMLSPQRFCKERKTYFADRSAEELWIELRQGFRDRSALSGDSSSG